MKVTGAELANSVYCCDCLTLVQRLPDESVDLVYVDPPWDTEADIDDGELEEYGEGQQHTAYRRTKSYTDERQQEIYLQFLATRLFHFHKVLKHTGSLFIHLDPRRSTSIRLILDRIFDGSGFRNQFILPNDAPSFGNRGLRPDYSTLLWYSKSDAFTYNPPTRPVTSEELDARYPYEDSSGRYRLVSLITQRQAGLRYEWRGVTPEEGYGWRYTSAQLEKLDQRGLISLDLSRKLPAMKQYAPQRVEIGSIWDDLSRRVGRSEAAGFFSQQSEALLLRIVNLATDPDAVILDPFCGSGTTLVAAHKSGRTWIGCDISPKAYEIVLDRLKKQLGLVPGRDLRYGDVDTVTSYFQGVRQESFEQSCIKLWGMSDAEELQGVVEQTYVPEPAKVSPLVMTEGATDWKHLKAAYVRLKSAGLLPEDFDIKWNEYEGDRGDSELLAICRGCSQVRQPRPTIMIFDRDVERTVKTVTGTSSTYRDWGNNVYSFAIPVPGHRKDTPQVCIELYYSDDDIKREDSAGRRLYLSTEFLPTSGRHSTRDLNCLQLNKLKGLNIIDAKVFNKAEENVALPKSDFARNVLDQQPNFDDLDVFEFTRIFDVIQEIMEMT